METTEKIVEAYCRYICKWFTIPNIKCDGQYEIDLLALEHCPEGGIGRYHIESGISISGSYSKLTNNAFSIDRLKVRVEQAGQRRTIGYFEHRKFGPLQVLKKLAEYGFVEGNYKKIIVSWGSTKEAEDDAKEKGIIIWDFRKILKEIAEACCKQSTYFTDDTLRTLQLFARAGNS